MDSRVVKPDDVLQLLMNDGTIDAIRMKVISQLKANEEMKRDTMMMVEQSKVLNSPGAETQSKRDLFDALRKELETPVLEKASKAVWELIVSTEGVGKEITDTVDRAYCRLTGLATPPATENCLNGTACRKRSFEDTELDDGDDEDDVVGNGNGKRHLVGESSEDSGTPKSKTPNT